ncbi:MAG: hypothetical protein ACJ8IR_09020 [Alphaproteobacteria bacterium]
MALAEALPLAGVRTPSAVTKSVLESQTLTTTLLGFDPLLLGEAADRAPKRLLDAPDSTVPDLGPADEEHMSL